MDPVSESPPQKPVWQRHQYCSAHMSSCIETHSRTTFATMCKGNKKAKVEEHVAEIEGESENSEPQNPEPQNYQSTAEEENNWPEIHDEMTDQEMAEVYRQRIEITERGLIIDRQRAEPSRAHADIYQQG